MYVHSTASNVLSIGRIALLKDYLFTAMNGSQMLFTTTWRTYKLLVVIVMDVYLRHNFLPEFWVWDVFAGFEYYG